jgi:hypothetical protein
MASGTEFPNKDIRLTEKFIREHEPLIFTTAVALKRAMESGQAVDFDAREALEALIRTYRTLESGLIYETRPQNPYAAGIQESLQQSIAEFRKEMAEKLGMHSLRDADVLGTLVFVQRLEIQHNNGRRRGRAFLDFLTSYLPEPPAATVAV